MKKLMVVMVLLVSSVTFASVAPYLELTVGGVDIIGDIIAQGSTVTVNIRMGTSPLVLFVGSVLEVTGGTLTTGPVGYGSWSSVNDQAFAAANDWGAGFDVGMSGTTNPGWAADDLIYSFTFTADVIGAHEVDAIGGSWGTGGWAADQTSAGVDAILPFGAFEVVVPEPMTMALLGLGGLFLRRRK